MNSHFICPNTKCAHAIDSTILNALQLKVLRRTAKTCPSCGKSGKFAEQASLPNIQTNTNQFDGGTTYEENQKNIAEARRKNSRRARAEKRGAGLH